MSHDSQGDTGELFDKWCQEHSYVADNLTFLVEGPNNSSRNLFAQQRKEEHARIRNELVMLNDKIETEKDRILNQINYSSRAGIPNVGLCCYDNIKYNLMMRKMTYAQRYVQKLLLECYNLKYNYLQDYRNYVSDALELFSDPDLIPEEKIVLLFPSFFDLKYDSEIEIILRKIEYLTTYITNAQMKIAHIDKPTWVKSFRRFFYALVVEETMHLDPDLSYTVPHEAEISLSRCYFNHLSPLKTEVDKLIREYVNAESNEFLEQLISKCNNILERCKLSFKSLEKSVALLILFRTFFNRCYEKYPSRFCIVVTDDLNKVEELSKIPASKFTLPTSLIMKNTEEVTINELFSNDQYYTIASMFLDQACFRSNPIDALYEIHKTLNSIHKAAIINRLGTKTASVSDVNQLLCFDDLFSLFFGTLMISKTPTIYYLLWFIVEFIPKQSLSPSFEYAMANLEALVMYLRKISVEELLKPPVQQTKI